MTRLGEKMFKKLEMCDVSPFFHFHLKVRTEKSATDIGGFTFCAWVLTFRKQFFKFLFFICTFVFTHASHLSSSRLLLAMDIRSWVSDRNATFTQLHQCTNPIWCIDHSACDELASSQACACILHRDYKLSPRNTLGYLRQEVTKKGWCVSS